MNFAHRSLVSLTSLVAVAVAALSIGCSNTDSASVDDGTNEGAATVREVSGLAIDFAAVTDQKPATAVDPDFPDMTTCDTNIEYVTISGTKFDDRINAILKGSSGVPSACETPESNDSRASIRFLGKEVLSVAESGSYFTAGAAHPSFEMRYKNVDLTTGELLTLDRILVPSAGATLLRSIRAQIGAQKSVSVDADGKRTVTKLDADSKSALLGVAQSVLARPLDKITSFSISPAGVRIDLVNDLPHVVQSLDSEYTVRWSTLDRAGALVPAMRQRFLAK